MGRLIAWVIAFFQSSKDDVSQIEDRFDWIVRWLNSNRNWLTITGMLLVSIITDPFGFVSTFFCAVSTEALSFLPNHPDNLKVVHLLQFFDSQISGIGSGLALEFLSFCAPALVFWPMLRAARRWI